MRSRWAELLRGSVINKVIRRSGPIDIHVVNHRPSPDEQGLLSVRRRRRQRAALSLRRQVMGWLVAGIALPVLTVALTNLRGHFTLPSVLLLYLLVAISAAAIGGFYPALATAGAGFLLVNWFFTPPLHRFTISEAENLLALIVFLIVAARGERPGRRGRPPSRRGGTRARAEAETLARLAATMGNEDPLAALVGSLRTTFGLRSVAVLRRDGERVDRRGRSRNAGPGPSRGGRRRGGPLRRSRADPRRPPPGAEDRRVLNAFAAQLAAAVERNRLQRGGGPCQRAEPGQRSSYRPAPGCLA